MLLQFAVENYACFADQVVLSLRAVPGEAHPEGQVVEVPGIGPVLRTLVLYGPNASGKSRLVEAFDVLRHTATEGIRPGESLPVVPHKLDPKWADKPTAFQLDFAVEDLIYAYGLEATAERVVSEWLYRGDAPIFEREGQQITIGEGLPLDEHRRAFYGFVAEGTRPEQPFLAELRSRNAAELEPLFDFLLRCGTSLTVEKRWAPRLVQILLRHPWTVHELGEFLREADTGVRSLRIVAASELLQHRIERGEQLSWGEVGEAARSVRLEFLHEGISGQDIPLSLEELSDGTRRLTNLAFDIVLGMGRKVTVIDELDRSFHTALSRHLMQRINHTPGIQFIVTTHDTNLLDAGVFGRDAIWFVEKDRKGAAHLQSLVEFKREQLDALQGRLEQGYLQGRFGAIPVLGTPAQRRWTVR